MVYALARELRGVTEEDYARVVEEFGPTPPEGLIVHASSIVDGAVRFIEVWESKGLRDRFVQASVAPVRRAATSPGGPVPAAGAQSFDMTVQHLVHP